MDLVHKTTILFSETQFSSLKKIAKAKGKSVGELIRIACEQVYASDLDTGAADAVKELEGLYLPVGSPAEMKEEMVPQKQLP